MSTPKMSTPKMSTHRMSTHRMSTHRMSTPKFHALTKYPNIYFDRLLFNWFSHKVETYSVRLVHRQAEVFINKLTFSFQLYVGLVLHNGGDDQPWWFQDLATLDLYSYYDLQNNNCLEGWHNWLKRYTLLHELACNIVSYCTSGCGIFTSRRRVKCSPRVQ